MIGAAHLAQRIARAVATGGSVRIALAALLTLAWLVNPAFADGDPAVDSTVPFTGEQLDRAIRLRQPVDGAVSDVRVVRTSGEHITITVGERSQTITLAGQSGAAAARSVAILVVEMSGRTGHSSEGSEAPVGRSSQSIDSERPPLEPRVLSRDRSRPSRLSLRVAPVLIHDDNGNGTAVLSAAASYRLAPETRLVATVGLGRMSLFDSDSWVAPVRLGIEGRASWLAVEIGGIAIPYRESVRCGGVGMTRESIGAAKGLFGAGRVSVPVNDKVSLVGEMGGYLLMGNDVYEQPCRSGLGYQTYAGWFGVGLEWSLSW